MILQRPLITGAGGFIGAHLALRLSKMEEVEYVYLVDIPDAPRLRQFRESNKFRIIDLDLCSSSAGRNLPQDATSVFALAAFNGTGRFYTNPLSVLKNSSYPTLAVIEAYAGKVPIVYSSSSEVYASTVESFNWEIPTSENVPISIADVYNPRWSYATAKLFGEIALNSAAIELGASGAIVRYHNVFGPNMGYDHFIPDFIQRAKLGVFSLTGPKQTRAFMYIDDAVEGTIAALKAASRKVPLYHLGSNEELSILAAAESILSKMGFDSFEIETFDPPVGSVARRCANTKKAELELGWRTQINFEDGIERYLHSLES
jgi:UDP-glucose 4-epimerase